MRIASLLAGTVVVVGMAAATTPAAAAPVVPEISPSQSQVELAGYWRDRGWGHHRWRGGWGYCRGWRHECANRWGWGTWRFRRCLARHGC